MYLVENERKKGGLLSCYSGLVQAHVLEILKKLTSFNRCFIAKKPFLEAISEANLVLVIRLRKDSRM